VSIPPSLALHPGVERRRVAAAAGELSAFVAEPPATAQRRPPALLVPGYTGSKEDFLPVLAPLAAAGHLVVAIDLRGQWESGGPEDPAAYTLDALAKDVAAVVAALGEPVHLVGHSFGGLVTRRAVVDGLRPLSLGLVGSGPAALGGPRAALVGLMRPLLEQGGVAALVQAAEAAEDGDPRKAELSEDVRQFLRDRLAASPAAALLTMGEELTTAADEVDLLRETGIPVLVAHGEADDAWTPTEQRSMADRLDARYVSIGGAVHSPACETPDAMVDVLLEFWQSVGPTRRP
jgi:pimeloyl-ACP methyl ester carboxylesterase